MKLESKNKKPRKLSKQQLLIKKLVNVEFSQDRYFWSREMKIINKLIKIYGIEFLEWIKPPSGYKIQTLVFFLTGDGKNYLSDQLLEYKKETIDITPKVQKIELAETKIGEDVLIQKKPKTLKDFLNLFN